jgi:hypothetical protein
MVRSVDGALIIKSMSESFFLPTEIPWQDLKGKQLEELLYWLFDAMGAKELQWRIGGTGQGAADQGRDLEMSFYTSLPDGELAKQHWWVEAKGRASSVEPADVKSSVINVAERTDIDVFVLATNAAFSNPTRDWVKKWQLQHPIPKIKLWEKHDLEKHCSKNPVAVVRLFGQILGPEGKLRVAKTKFWDYANYTDGQTLEKLWIAKNDLRIDPESLFALIASELANGKITERSWAAYVDAEVLLHALGFALFMTPYLASRANDLGIKHFPMIQSLSYMILVMLHRFGHKLMTAFLSNVWVKAPGELLSDEDKTLILKPILNNLQNEIRDVCTSDCTRISTCKATLSDDEVERYWDRLKVKEVEHEDESGSFEFLVIETHGEPCKVGFHVSDEISCPLMDADETHSDLKQTLQVIERICSSRVVKAPIGGRG